MPPKPPSQKFTLAVDQTHVNLDNSLEVVRVLTLAITEVFARSDIRSRYNPKIPALVTGWIAALFAGAFIGIPTVLKVPLQTRRPFIITGLILFWAFYTVHKLLEARDNTILVLTDERGRTVRVSGELCLKTGLYTIRHKKSVLLQKSIGEYYNVDGDLMGENVRQDIVPLCSVIQDILKGKTE